MHLVVPEGRRRRGGRGRREDGRRKERVGRGKGGRREGQEGERGGREGEGEETQEREEREQRREEKRRGKIHVGEIKRDQVLYVVYPGSAYSSEATWSTGQLDFPSHT